jgi:hypothetical protein
MVVASMTRAALSRSILPLLALLGIAYLVAMIVLGAQPMQRQLVKFEASGVLRMAPQFAERVTLSRAGQQVVFIRAKGGNWNREDGAAHGEAAPTHIETGLKMLHNSAPVREIELHELIGIDTRPFLLENPEVIIGVAGSGHTFTARFGGLNPEGFLQYMQLDGDQRIYLMSRFIGAELVSAFEAAQR